MKAIITLLALGLSASAVFAAEPIEGKWKTANGETADIRSCDGSFCITLKTGKFAGKTIGTLKGTDSSYTGEITDPETNKTYSGSANISGNAMRLKGCVLGILCKSQSWTRI
ncbi:DUF2147 domain-containing protein [Allorhizobium sp. BGMRC 0089]|uniref:DUF2147 domain-containing protein n=1 Tax=Allorhizobium sonneratiae TaxID=2934936 RepID=UPI002033B733|nr:DUF2147 domain-containing protein [Allorhizobium sonneratiae]MCM2291960.1 DUF2147 domain-containing protein [Allorhizobium sonneratiae]